MNEKTSLKYLLLRLIQWRITPDEYAELKQEIKSSDDETVDSALQVLWEENCFVPMDSNIKEKVRHNLALKTLAVPTQKSSKWWKIAAAIAIPVLICLNTYLYFSSELYVTDETFMVFTKKGEKTQLVLPDGSQIYLNSDSKLSYNSGFNKKNRILKLEGEAFFDVAPDKENAFTVQTNNLDVIVHGTAFNVSSYEDAPDMSVTLLRGKVALANHSTGQILTMMVPDQLVRVNKANLAWDMESCDAELESLWTQNKLKFENTPAEKVFQKLERWYGVDIQVENPKSDVCYGFTLKTESLREILEIINKVSPITYHINGEEVSIRYR